MQNEARQNLYYWSGFWIPPLAWAMHLQVTYVLVHFACSTGYKFPLHLSSLFFLILSLLAGVVAWRAWKQAGQAWPVEWEGGLAGSRSFLAVIGLMNSILFSLVILGQWIPHWVFNPCQQ